MREPKGHGVGLPPDLAGITELGLGGCGAFDVPVCGTDRKQAALRRVGGWRLGLRLRAEVPVQARLYVEHDSRFDPSAVRVDINGQAAGYLEPARAVTFREDLGEAEWWGVPFRCKGRISRNDGGELQVWLNFGHGWRA